MCHPPFRPQDIPALPEGPDPLGREIKGEQAVFKSVAMRTIHMVLFEEAADGAYFLPLRPQIERPPLFRERTSGLWAAVESPKRIRMRTWQRGGVGESVACGTGACAVFRRACGSA